MLIDGHRAGHFEIAFSARLGRGNGLMLHWAAACQMGSNPQTPGTHKKSLGVFCLVVFSFADYTSPGGPGMFGQCAERALCRNLVLVNISG